MIQLIALDIDDTLTKADGSISEQGLAAARQVQRLGKIVILASARPPQGVQAIASLLCHGVYRICYLGALIQDAEGQDLQRLTIDMDIAIDIAKFADKNKISLTITIRDIEYHTQGQMRLSMTKHYSINSAETLLTKGEPPTLIGTVGHEHSLMLYEYVTKRHPTAVHTARTFDGNSTCLSTLVVNIHAQKGRALKTICSLLSVRLKDVLAIGDSESDITMFRVAGVSVAVANASQSAKDAASMVAPGQNGEGVEWALNHLVQPYSQIR